MNKSTLVPREEMSDLDRLARNVHEWPENTPHVVLAGDVLFEHGAVFCESHVVVNAGTTWQPLIVHRKQWLARRAELQNKPSLADHPDAKCLVQHGSGQWWKNIETCDVEPGFEGFWRANNIGNGIWTYVCQGEVIGDWRDTLEKRPETNEIPAYSNQPKPSNDIPECAKVKQFEPFVSAEDAQQELSELEMLAKVSHLISDKRHRITPSKYTKTIHGVSVDVYDVLQAWCVSNPALQHLIKKALQCGQRGHKDNAQDLQDIIDSAIRAKELEC